MRRTCVMGQEKHWNDNEAGLDVREFDSRCARIPMASAARVIMSS